MGAQWFVARTQPHRERWAAENVVRQGHHSYCPRVMEFVRIGGRQREAVLKPLFPGYLFVLSRGQWHFLLGTFGISSLILFGGLPATVSQAEIDRIKEREQDGVVVLPAAQQRLRAVGDSVRVRKGAFEGRNGVYQGMVGKDRGRVLLDFLGRKTTVLIAEDLLEAA